MPDLTAIASLPLADWNGGPGWWIVFPIGWFALILLFFALFRRGWGPGCGWGGWGGWGYYGRPGRGPWRADASEVLDRRFAEGEIDAEEYRARRDALDRR